MTYSTIGASCLWPWNCLLIAGTFIQPHLSDAPALQRSYSSYVMLAFTATSLLVSSILAMTPTAFGSRVRLGEKLIAVGFSALAFITTLPIPTAPYFVLFVLLVAIVASGSTSIQNGATAITQRIPGGAEARALLVGQSFSGIVPPLFSIALAFSNSRSKDPGTPPTSTAVILFLSSVLLSLYSLYSFRGQKIEAEIEQAEIEYSEPPSYTELWDLLAELKTPMAAIFICLICSLSYPLFANTVTSPRIPTSYFSPTTHLLWNSGDLLGRIICEKPELRVKNPRKLIIYALARLLLLPLLISYCWVSIKSDLVYLVLMFAYGVSNGHLLSCSISAAPLCIAEDQRPAAGGLIGMVISFGLVAGSVVSFLIAPFVHQGS